MQFRMDPHRTQQIIGCLYVTNYKHVGAKYRITEGQFKVDDTSTSGNYVWITKLYSYQYILLVSDNI